MRHDHSLVARESVRIRFASGIWDKMLASVGRLPPEQYAILGGKLDDPHYVTDFFPMPPLMGPDGKHRASGATVTLNGPFIEHLLNTTFLPFGKYFLGVMHSHPGDLRQLSGGIDGSGYGDIPSMRQHLKSAAQMDVPWRDYIAPIVTRTGDNPRVDVWIVSLDAPEPIPAVAVWEKDTPSTLRPSSPPAAALSVQDEAIERMRFWGKHIDDVLANTSRAMIDRRAEADILRTFRSIDMKDAERRLKAILQE
ncbi:hypothetical protein [Jiella marina]|uniref:hypothetical protein n=1 Tax=Jiella sp. LLJ827 TaxID=2917712 RepID=UPI0021018025|nr:hypothetical protein [Jiella sp. LLJ827]MCQ0990551.1 hypothetical protein [Jiella sp. LLJ827]